MRRCFVVLTALLSLAFGVEAAAQSFDHSTTAFPLEGSHIGVECESCHVNGVFAGTPTNCEYCHAGMSNIKGSTRPPNHINSTIRCGECHTPAGWDQVPRVEHSEVLGSCQSCHDNRQATGKPAGHVATTQDCDSCHTTASWAGAMFDHSNITGACSACHNGVEATGKPSNHVVTTEDCGTCHGTDAWIPAAFDHTGITGACSTCHNGVQATGKPSTHIQTTADCGDCHSVVAWTPASFDHSNVTSPCSSCHNGTSATGKPNNHFVTSLECDSCHSTTAWTPISYMHTGNYPGDHRQQLTCNDCHTSNAETVPWPYAAYQPDCAACHANRFESDAHPKAPGIRYTVSELRDCTGACHVYTDSTFTTISQTRNGHHRVSDGNF